MSLTREQAWRRIEAEIHEFDSEEAVPADYEFCTNDKCRRIREVVADDLAAQLERENAELRDSVGYWIKSAAEWTDRKMSMEARAEAAERQVADLRAALARSNKLLERWECGLIPVGDYDLRGETRAALDASPQEPTPCPDCGGSGEVLGGYVTHDMASDAGEPSMEGMAIPDRCPTCRGDGYVSPQEKP